MLNRYLCAWPHGFPGVDAVAARSSRQVREAAGGNQSTARDERQARLSMVPRKRRVPVCRDDRFAPGVGHALKPVSLRSDA